MDYLKLLEHSYAMAASNECPPDSRLEFLGEQIFNFTTYDGTMSALFAEKAIEVCDAITRRETFDYIGSADGYKWFILMCNMPFFADRLEWGTSIRGAWWDSNSLESCGLWDGDEQLLSLTFTPGEWSDFTMALVEFARRDVRPTPEISRTSRDHSAPDDTWGKAVPVYQHRSKNGPMLRWFDCSEETFMAMEHNEHDRKHFDRRILYTHPASADAERLAEALHNLVSEWVAIADDGDATLEDSTIGYRACANQLSAMLAAHSSQAQPPAASVTDAMQELAGKYHELLWAVARKFPGETRHETALRYIREAECQEAALASQENPNG